MTVAVSSEDFVEAQRVLKGITHVTPLQYSHTFSQMCNCSVYLKEENRQRTGSFKIRGAYYKISKLDQEARAKGVLAASAGNHAQGVALAAHLSGIRATIIMPIGAPISKAMATRGYGAEVIRAGETYDDAYHAATELRKETGATYIHAFNDRDIIVGQGTLGLEILEQLPDVDAIVAPIGGGGLLAGIAAAVKSRSPQVKIFGVQAAGAPGMYLSKQAGSVICLDAVDTIADGIAVKRPGELSFAIIDKLVDGIVTVSDEEIAQAILLLSERAKVVTEGAGATAFAAVLSRKLQLDKQKVAIVLSGGNIDVNMISHIMDRGLAKAGRRMRFRTVLTDKPGKLQELIAMLAQTRANIVSINHDRTRARLTFTQADVEITVETRDHEHINEIKTIATAKGYEIEVIE